MRTRRTLRGHLAKIYAMHWATDSRSVDREQLRGAGGWALSEEPCSSVSVHSMNNTAGLSKLRGVLGLCRLPSAPVSLFLPPPLPLSFTFSPSVHLF